MIEIEDPVGFKLQIGEMDELAEKIWILLRTNQKKEMLVLMPYLNSLELPFYHHVGVRNDIVEPKMDLQCEKIIELF